MGVYYNEQRAPEPVQLVHEHGIELARFRVLEEPSALRPLVERDGAGYAIVLICELLWQRLPAGSFL